MRLITVTENVRHCLTYYESLKLHLKKDVRDRFSIKSEIDKLTDAQKKTKFLNYFKKPQPKRAPPNPPESSDGSERRTEEEKSPEKKQE